MNELYHHGIKGMHWGVRRYQNKSGGLTSLGRNRYNGDGNKSNRGFKKEDIERTKKIADTSRQFTNESRNLGNAITKIQNKRIKRMDLSSMSDQELRNRINREMLERQYDNTFNPKRIRSGREYAMDVLEVAGTALGATASALSIALAIKELRKG